MPLSRRWLFIAFAAGGIALSSGAAEETSSPEEAKFIETIAPFFAPFTTDRAALAPDGKHVAYTLHKDDTAYVIIMDVDYPQAKVTAAVAKDRARPKTAEGVVMGETAELDPDNPFFRSDEKTPATVPFMVWSSGNRLLISNDVPEIVAIDSDGQHGGKLVDADDVNVLIASDVDPNTPQSHSPFVRRPPKILEVLPDDPDHVLISAEGVVQDPGPFPAHLAVSVFRADVHTGKLKSVHDLNFDANTKVLYDKSGRPRLTYPLKERRQNYTYHNGRSSDFTKWVEPALASTLFLAPENYFAARTFPVAFDYDPDVVYLASNAGRDTRALYACDLRTKKGTLIGPEKFPFDVTALDSDTAASQLVFDRFQKKLAGIRVVGVTPSTHWLDPDLAKIQLELDRAFPSRFAQILEWDRARARFLVQVSSCSDPGRFYIFFREDNRALEFVRLVPDLDLDEVSATKPFEFDTPAHVHLTGYVTQPANARINPPPLAIFCHDPLLGRALPAYQRDVQALAAMGFVVVQVNFRGTSGFGRAHREAFTSGIVDGVDRPPLDDLVATADWIASRQKVDRKRIALFGVGYGGTLALRALEAEPERFRCAITFDAPTDLRVWLNFSDAQEAAANAPGGPSPDQPAAATIGSGSVFSGSTPARPTVDFPAELRRTLFTTKGNALDALSPLQNAGKINRPVLLIQDISNPSLPQGQAPALRSALKKRGIVAESIEVGAEFTQRLPHASAQTYAKIAEFINLNLYDYDVKVGTPQVK